MPQLLLATNNPGKTAELRTLLGDCGWEIVAPAEIGIDFAVEETGESYEENATAKATFAAEASGLVSLADDSGIEIDALGGAPGVHSANFLGKDVSYETRFAEILQRLAGLPQDRRGARFVCVIAIVDPRSGRVRLARGEAQGLIADRPRGDRGFGYDPIFWLPQQSLTMAELEEHQKGIISHRGRAAAVARQILKELLYEHQGHDPSYTRLRAE
jgi:XTP/dITP diphosphohydrolase